jgi:hypothetical protein
MRPCGRISYTIPNLAGTELLPSSSAILLAFLALQVVLVLASELGWRNADRAAKYAREQILMAEAS